MKRYFCFILLFILTGCVSPPESRSYTKIDLTEKSITVPPGSDGLKGLLKDVLINEKWSMVVDSSLEATEGEAKEKVNLLSRKVYQTRYYLFVKSNVIDDCIEFTSSNTPSKYYRFDVSIIDTKSNTETLTMSGKSCSSQIVKDFRNHLQGN